MQKKTYYISTKKITECKKIFFFSDLHFRQNFPIEKLKKIVEQAELAEPDYICIAGDLVNDAKDIGNLQLLKAFLESLSRIAPVIMGFGNHDLLAKNDDNKWVYYINKSYISMLLGLPKFHLVDNNSWKDKEIEFTGITMLFDYYERYHESLYYTKMYMETIASSLLQTKQKELYQVLLFHSPISLLDLVEQKKLDCLTGTDLILSGHLHGGVPALLEFFLGHKGIVGPFNLADRLIHPNYVRGHMKFDNLDAVISTGISKFNIPATDLLLPPNVNNIIINKPKVFTKK